MKKLHLFAPFIVCLLCIGCKKEDDVIRVQSPAPAQPTEEISSIMADTDRDISESFATTATVVPSSFVLGVNGHPFNSPAYTNTPVTQQIRFLKSMAIGYYRFDLITHTDGTVQSPGLLNELISAATQQNIQLIPTLGAHIDYSSSASSAYNSGYNYSRNFALRYGKYFTYYGLGNELDNKVIHRNSSGQLPSDYDPAKIRIVASYLKGMDAGIKSVDHTAKTMVDESFLHYGFLQLMERNGVGFDIVACHWYADMEGAAAKAPYFISNITTKLSSLFKKPIWFTEVNKRYRNNVSKYEFEQDQFFKSFINKCKQNKQVKSILIYELFDEPSRSYAEEAHFGLIKWISPYSAWQYKLAAKNLQVK